MSAYLGSDVELECRVEASPRPETVWLTGTGQKLEELMEQMEILGVGNGLQPNNSLGPSSDEVQQQQNLFRDQFNAGVRASFNGAMSKQNSSKLRKKYTFEEESDGGYRTIMRLTVRRLESVDFGSYKCVAKNGLGEKEGLVRLYGKKRPKK